MVQAVAGEPRQPSTSIGVKMGSNLSHNRRDQSIFATLTLECEKVTHSFAR